MANADKLLREAILAEAYGDIRLGYRSGDLTYVGFHNKHNVSADDNGWVIKKLNYTSGNLTRVEGPLTGCSWTGVTNAGWG